MEILSIMFKILSIKVRDLYNAIKFSAVVAEKWAHDIFLTELNQLTPRSYSPS
jgi:hypothetical protein